MGLPSSGNEKDVGSVCRETSDARSLESEFVGLAAVATESTVEGGSFGAGFIGASTPIVSSLTMSKTGKANGQIVGSMDLDGMLLELSAG